MSERSNSDSWYQLTPAGRQMVARGKRLIEGPHDYRNAEMLAPTESDVRQVQDEARDALLDEIERRIDAARLRFSTKTATELLRILSDLKAEPK